ncbi:DUF3224 domain-containing protein [Spirosoma terrae]|uniref:DUF3224 domain-containing protein n=1 Tax=Spirosoma terrae TaxID=1968276 RepID=A0A6L9L4Y6_9BACT|nr:DUF3224 domain-containing protein [Spirosoma terrae]NDU95510.1 DUF3224 domain-containing protein [Spirosoma terrae]
MKATAKRIYKTWKEEPYDELADAPKLTHSRVTNTLEGDIEGESWEEYLFMYRREDSCSFILMERIIGKLGGLNGSFVVHGYGTYEDDVAQADLTIIPGSGTGQLIGLRGSGRFVAPKNEYTTVTFDYQLD